MGADPPTSSDRPATGPLRRLAWARAVAADGRLPGSSYRLAAFIADAYDEAGGRFATGRAKIARLIGVATSTVQHAIDQLADHGWLTLVEGPSRGRNATAYAITFRSEPTGPGRSVVESATDRSRPVGSSPANRPADELQPTGPGPATDRTGHLNRPVQAGRYQRDQNDQREDQTRASAAEAPPPGSEVGDKLEARDQHEALRWEGFTDTQRARLEAFEVLGALLAHPTSGEDLRREWLDRTRGLSGDLVATVLGAGGRGFPSAFDRAAKAFGAQIHQEREMRRAAAEAERQHQAPLPESHEARMRRFQEAQALIAEIGADGIPGGSLAAAAALGRLAATGMGKLVKTAEDLELVRREWVAYQQERTMPRTATT
jgi:hypothetical protein